MLFFVVTARLSVGDDIDVASFPFDISRLTCCRETP
jgi:hypothetical protein